MLIGACDITFFMTSEKKRTEIVVTLAGNIVVIEDAIEINRLTKE